MSASARALSERTFSWLVQHVMRAVHVPPGHTGGVCVYASRMIAYIHITKSAESALCRHVCAFDVCLCVTLTHTNVHSLQLRICIQSARC